jgi:hypothetical protein
MKSMKTYLVVWLSGMIAGFILMERWQRTSGHEVPAAETDTASTTLKVSAERPKVSAVVVAGATADVERARRFLERVMPFGRTSAPSVAQLRRAGRVAMPGNTPNQRA